ncbi:MAG: hypothetical protein MUO21_07500, partial [Nitrososphaeraceae archaeon]|nr:hypothetical protein [Nitrososphaeraceae archaeon]
MYQFINMHMKHMNVQRFLTGHDVFDEIVNLYYGSTTLLLDHSFIEGRHLLFNLLTNNKPYEIVSSIRGVPNPDERIVPIGEKSVSDASLTVNDLRNRFPEEIIIHNYFPDFIIRHGSDVFLRLLESWHDSITSGRTVEFYLLPKGAFQEIERKIMSIVDGVIEIKVSQINKRFGLSFIPMRCCKPEYHLRDFPYRIDSGRLLIEWDREFVEKLPSVTL